jgi:myosin I
LENIRVRRAGFCWRSRFEHVLHRYRILNPKLVKISREELDIRSATTSIMDALNIHRNEYKMGKTKLFIRSPKTVFSLEEAREALIPSLVQKIQRWYRKKVCCGGRDVCQKGSTQLPHSECSRT